ncbi:sulfotransferase 1 family member D1-like isoform X3 [Lissotriton helveticus]
MEVHCQEVLLKNCLIKGKKKLLENEECPSLEASYLIDHLCIQMEKQETFIPRQPLKIVGGIPFLKYFADGWAEVESFQARPDDLLICTYPKAGTTWISEIVDCILNNGDVEKTKHNPINIRVPFLEFSSPHISSGVELLVNSQSPRIIKTHLPVNLLPKTFWEKNCKIVYIARNAKDVAVSYYYFYKMAFVHPDPGSWVEFLEKYMTGEVAYGSWYEHVKGWWEKRKDNCILYLFYEDMKEDPKQEIRKIMQFMEKDLEEEILERINHHTSFKEMKDNLMTNYKTTPECRMDHQGLRGTGRTTSL